MSARAVCTFLLVMLPAGSAYGYGYYEWAYEVYPAYPYPPPAVYAPPPVVVAAPPVVELPPPPVYRVRYGRVKISSLSSRGYWRPEGLEVVVRYKVKFKRMPVGDSELVIQFLDHGQVVTGPDGRAIVAVVPLDAPTKVRSRKVEFKGTTAALLPGGSFLDTRRLRADARVTDRSIGHTLIRRSRSVR